MPDFETTYGVFKEEIKNRFLCIVNINNEDTLCYIPSSCRLSNFIDLKNRVVILKPIKKKDARTKYSVYAVKYRNSFVLLNLSEANSIIERQIHRKTFCFLGNRKAVMREKTIHGYKSDLYISDTDTIVEVKSLLSIEKEAKVPSVFSERGNRQLVDLKRLLQDGHKVCYMFVSLYSGVKEIHLNTDQQEYTRIFNECIANGMTMCAFSIYMHDGVPIIKSRIEVNMF